MPAPDIGSLIRQLRKRRDWPLKELAARAALDLSYVVRIERNEVVPSEVALARLAAALDVPVDELTSTSVILGSAVGGRLVRRDVLELPVYAARRLGQLHDLGGRSMTVEASGAFVVEIEGDDLTLYGLAAGDRVFLERRDPEAGELVALRLGTEIWLGQWRGDRAEISDGSFRVGRVIGVAAYRLQPIAPAIQ